MYSRLANEYGMTWLQAAPRIKLLSDTNKRKPYPLSWAEQNKFFNALPNHLSDMALFAVNTGCRDGENCSLRWDWHVPVPDLATAVFIIPGEYVKNGDERLVVLNSIANEIVNKQQGKNTQHVFTYKGKPVIRTLNTAWIRARKTANLEKVRVHDLKNTLGRRLRATGVSFEDRQDLLGHRSDRITTHYSAAELSRLLESANSVCANENNTGNPEIIVLRRISAS